MPRRETMVQLSDELLDALDGEAARRGVSRSAVVRDAVARYLADNREAQIGASIAEGYRRIPPSTPDAWGSPDAEAHVADDEALARLDAEEREAGLDPW